MLNVRHRTTLQTFLSAMTFTGLLIRVSFRLVIILISLNNKRYLKNRTPQAIVCSIEILKTQGRKGAARAHYELQL